MDFKKEIQNKLRNEELKLKKLKKDQDRHVKYRQNKKSKIEEVCKKNSEIAEILRPQTKSGRPRIEDNQPEFLKLLTDIASRGCGADGRRRTEILRSCQTLDDLHKELLNFGIEVSRSATYTRLIPRRADSEEGKRHKKTVPVKLIKAQTSEHKSHQDTDFCVATIKGLDLLASFLGPQQVFCVSIDDKARVRIGVTAANKQSSLLMNMQYRITLPDHDWVKGERHSLIPSVYAGITIKPFGLGDENYVTYSGPTAIKVRSGKHDSSSAKSHAKDFESLFENDDFKIISKTIAGCVKPVVIIYSDGGPDENPRFASVVNQAIIHFKKFDLDAYFAATNAPGRSAFNRYYKIELLLP